MLDIRLIRESRTEHAKAVRRATGTNDFRDKCVNLVPGAVMPCIGTILCKDNLVCKMFV